MHQYSRSILWAVQFRQGNVQEIWKDIHEDILYRVIGALEFSEALFINIPHDRFLAFANQTSTMTALKRERRFAFDLFHEH